MNLKVDDKSTLPGEYFTQTHDDRNDGILKAWLPIWVANSYYNFPEILERAKSQDIGIDALRKVDRNEPAVIVGSGPSLDKTAPLLKDWKGAVFACGSNAIIPTRWGHQPEYIVVFDGGDSLYPKMLGWNWQGSTLLTHPCASPMVIRNWKWDAYFYQMEHRGVDFFDTVSKIAYGDLTRFPYQAPPRLCIYIGNAGCTVNNAIQIAHFLGYGPLFLIGCDFGYPEGKERCTRWEYDLGEWKSIGSDSYTDRSLHLSDNGILTTEEQIEYKNALMMVYKIDHPQLFDCSEGIITELPKADFKEVVKKYGRGFKKQYRSFSEIDEIVNAYNDKWIERVNEFENARNVNRESGGIPDPPQPDAQQSSGKTTV